MVVEEELPQETPTTSMPPSVPWSAQEYFSHLLFGAIGARELVLVAGSAVAGGAMTLLTRSLFGS
ncbi:hypothetical protein HYDPIDRAFT_118443 [Hydnomerulius pinastri MD-312]|uniref:Uncharacterized protein n=1 Tax=Hydnomerulius pinastri MD-312 TaxID=994086 RepID=A0A0C9VP51_9AGAM|nr:hypothetical protein HYDPIDRAFT_118443 [Hydnomerulius pinastri MD-312]